MGSGDDVEIARRTHSPDHCAEGALVDETHPLRLARTSRIDIAEASLPGTASNEAVNIGGGVSAVVAAKVAVGVEAGRWRSPLTSRLVSQVESRSAGPGLPSPRGRAASGRVQVGLCESQNRARAHAWGKAEHDPGDTSGASVERADENCIAIRMAGDRDRAKRYGNH